MSKFSHESDDDARASTIPPRFLRKSRAKNKFPAESLRKETVFRSDFKYFFYFIHVCMQPKARLLPLLPTLPQKSDILFEVFPEKNLKLNET